MRRFLFILLSFSVLLLAGNDFTLLPRLTQQTRPFFEKYPDYNGKNITIFIMDTGVEISLPGLDKNPDGSVKVVDVYDAGQSGDIKWVEPEYRDIDGVTFLTNNDDIFLKDFEEFQLQDKEVYLGIIKEKTFQNSVAKDMNGNGKEDDAWGFITFQEDDENWAVIMDTDMDGSLKGEKTIHNYDKNHEYIMLPRKNPLTNHQWMALTVKIYPGKKITNFHFEDGAHGTHVAGIAAGYQINGDPDVNGLAPAARVVSIKISDGKLFGSATNTGAKKRGLEYISSYMKKHGGYGVINISFGIESSNEGFSAIDNIFNDFAVNNPNVIVCTSAGNEGPGLSSIGTPSAAQHIISSGALMHHTTGRDKFGWPLASPKVLQFSSRGGETTKPDVVSPGAEISTVPRWERNDFYFGTSMASPYTAGEIAAVLSGIIAEMPTANISSSLVQHGLRVTSTKLDGYTYLDQGNGMIDMLALFDWLKKEAGKEAPQHYQINIDTFNPTLPQKKSNSIYWRISDIKDVPEEVEVNIKPLFNDNMLQKEIDGFFAKYKIRSNAKWAKPLNKNISLLREIGETIKIRLDTENFAENEFRVAKISFIPDGKHQEIGQEMFVTVINPIRFDEGNNFNYSAEKQKVNPGYQLRYFLAMPFGSSALNIKVSADESDYAKLRAYILDKHGLPAGRLSSINSEDERYLSETTLDQLENGVYELVVLGDLSGKGESTFDVEVSFDGVKFCDEGTQKLSFSGGNAPSFSGKIIPVLDTYKHTSISGKISGYAKKDIISFGDNDTIVYPFEKTNNDKSMAFKIDMPLKHHTNFTDIMITAENSDGKQVRMSGISAKDNTFRLPASVPAGHYTLKILPAYADYAVKEKFDLDMEEVHYFEKEYTGRDTFPQNTLFQNEEYSYTIKLNDVPPMIPDGFYYYGGVTVLKNDKSLSQKEIRAER